MCFTGQTSEKMAAFPIVNIDFGIYRLIANPDSKAAVVFMSMCEDDSADIRKADAIFTKFCSERGRSLGSFWPDVDQRNRIFANQIDIDVTDVKGRWD